jgi:hypothetical protein
MPRATPSYVTAASIVGAPVSYKWSNDLGLKFIAAKDQNARLYEALDEASFKAKMSLGVAITEWTVWRFKGHVPIEDALLRLEAAWACAIDPRYAKSLRFKLTQTGADPLLGPFEIALDVLGSICDRFTKGSIYLAEPVVRQATLAKHVIPGKNVFSDWLSAGVRKAATTFPRNAKYDRKSGVFDASLEPPVPGEFFEPDFVYSEETTRAMLQAFLKSLDPEKNPYLRSPEELRQMGFTGTPYTF